MLEWLKNIVSQTGFMPHGHCYLWNQHLLALQVLSDALIFLSYVILSITLITVARRIPKPFSFIIVSFALFVFCCSVTHLMEIWTLWHPDYWASGSMKAITAIVSVVAAIWFLKLRKLLIRATEFVEKSTSEETFQTIANSIPELASMTHVGGERYWFNSRWLQYTGKTIDELQGFGWKSVHDPNILPEVIRRWEEARMNGQVFEMEYPLLGADGRYRWFLGRSTPIYDADKKITRWFSITTLIDKQKKRRDNMHTLLNFSNVLALARSIEEVAQATEHVLQTSMDSDCFVLYIYCKSTQALKLTYLNGITDEEKDIFKATLSPDANLPSQEAFDNNIPYFYNAWEYADKLSSKAKNILNTIHAKSLAAIPIVFGQDKVGVFGQIYQKTHMYSDSEREFLANIGVYCAQALERVRLFKHLQCAIQSRDDFLSIVSHELKTPLTSIELQTQMTKRNLTLRGELFAFTPDKMKTFVSQTEKQAQRLGRLIDDMLDISRIRTGHLTVAFSKINITTLIEEICEKMQPLAIQAHTYIQFKYQTQIDAECDAFRIEQVLTNIISNAIKYGAKSPIAVSIWLDDSAVFIDVIDQGPGIKKDDHDRIFQQFERANAKEASGFGLGLFISREIIKHHNGSITLKSDEGRGATFTVKIPQQQQPMKVAI